ncbi:MFS transporter [Nonomuraea typhae]|uniref:MFS transporter n=1 Tax=Nonomuraea typhae TaxID=2603600 RepID=UPI0012FA9233|nr:MFS transporter [Nonomuraea typhae]
MRSFGFLWSSSALSNLADGVLKVGAPLMAVGMTRSPGEVALVGVATTLPWLLLALPAGAVADRVDRRRVMVLANVLRAALLVAAGLLAWSGGLGLWVLVAAVLLSGTAEVFADTSAQSILPMTVPASRLAWANGRIVGAQTIGNDFIGSPVAGLLVTLLPAAILGAPGILYGAAGLLLLGMRGAYRPAPAPGASAGGRSMTADIREGLRYLWGHRFLRRLAISSGMLNLASAAFFAVFVLWAVGPGSRIGLTPEAYGLVMTAFAAGAVAASLVSDRVVRWAGEGPALVGSWLVNSLLLAVPVLAPHPAALFPVAVAWGATNAWSNVIVISLRQRIIPEGLLGRVNSAYRLIGMGGMPVGAAVAGVMGETWGLPSVFYGAVGVCVAAVFLIYRGLRARDTRSASAIFTGVEQHLR